jgi:hypothetical protein
MSDEKTLGRKIGYKKSTVEKGGHMMRRVDETQRS